MWLWPLSKPWEYSPLGYVLAIIWNCCEMAYYPMPFAGWAFGKITGYKGERIDRKK